MAIGLAGGRRQTDAALAADHRVGSERGAAVTDPASAVTCERCDAVMARFAVGRMGGEVALARGGEREAEGCERRGVGGGGRGVQSGQGAAEWRIEACLQSEFVCDLRLRLTSRQRCCRFST